MRYPVSLGLEENQLLRNFLLVLLLFAVAGSGLMIISMHRFQLIYHPGEDRALRMDRFTGEVCAIGLRERARMPISQAYTNAAFRKLRVDDQRWFLARRDEKFAGLSATEQRAFLKEWAKAPEGQWSYTAEELKSATEERKAWGSVFHKGCADLE